MDKKKRLAYLKEIDAHVGFHTGNGIAPQILDLKKVSDNKFVTNCNIRKVRNEDEQETYLRVNPNKTSNHCFNTSLKELANAPAFYDNVLEFDGKYYAVRLYCLYLEQCWR